MIPDLIPGQVVFVAGPVASGKTYLLQKWAERESHVLLLDNAGDHIDNPNFDHIWGNPRSLVERLDRDDVSSGFRVAYHPTASVEEGFDWCMSAVWQLDMPRFFFIDEMWELMSPQFQHPKMKVINKYARKANALGVIGSTQRLSDVHKDFTSAARMSILFQTSEANDIGAIRDRWGRDVEDALRGLRPLLYSDETGQVQQTPQAVLIKRGMGFEVIDVG
jgi:hypothetical protein